MASLNSTKNGLRYVQLSPGENPQRPKISLGRCTLKDARTARDNIENLITANRTGAEIATSTADWLNRTPEALRVRLERLGLVEARSGSRWTVAAFIADYISKRTDVKQTTLVRYRDAERKMAAFFQKDNIADVTVQQAKNFRVYLKTTVGLGENTLSRLIGLARQFFNAAIDAELITKNPFRGQPVSVRANDARFFYVTPNMARKVLDACPDSQWRLIFGFWHGTAACAVPVKSCGFNGRTLTLNTSVSRYTAVRPNITPTAAFVLSRCFQS